MHSRRHGFTLIELLIVIGIIAILAAILLPTVERVRSRARRAQCASQSRQIGIALVSFSHDHDGQFPMRVWKGSGGALESIQPANHIGGGLHFTAEPFQPLSNYLSNTRVLICPVDRRAEETNFAGLQSQNISYFVNPMARSGDSDSIVAGDANLAQDIPAQFFPGLGLRLRWTGQRHHFSGNVLFGDVHVEQWNNFAVPAGGKQPGTRPSPPNTPTYMPPISRPGGGGHGHGGPKPPTSGGGGGGGRGVFSQLDDVSRRHSYAQFPTSPPVVVVTQAPPATQPRPNIAPVVTNLPPTIETPMEAAPWPRRLSEHLTYTGRWHLYVLILIALAILLAFELLRRHRTRRRRAYA